MRGAVLQRMIAVALALPLLGAASPPRRIVSLNLCADQYLLALADPGQIAALTRLSRDPQMSAVADTAQRLPVTGGSAEEVLALRPDLLIAMPGQPAATMLRGRIATVDLPPANSYAEIVAQVRQIAAVVGHRERGEALIRGMDAGFARVSRDVGRGRVAADYQRRGYLTGAGTLIDELMRRVGLVNLARRLGKPALSQVSLEEIALARPDYLIVGNTDRVVDQGTELLHHPVIAHIPRLRLPQAWTVCGGPAYVRAAQALAMQLRRQGQPSRSGQSGGDR